MAVAVAGAVVLCLVAVVAVAYFRRSKRRRGGVPVSLAIDQSGNADAASPSYSSMYGSPQSSPRGDDFTDVVCALSSSLMPASPEGEETRGAQLDGLQDFAIVSQAVAASARAQACNSEAGDSTPPPSSVSPSLSLGSSDVDYLRVHAQGGGSDGIGASPDMPAFSEQVESEFHGDGFGTVVTLLRREGRADADSNSDDDLAV